MTQSNPREEALRLMDKRKLVEAEMDAIMARLSAPGAPGPSGSLTDKEGFPLADIDIPKIRADRHRLAVLKYDHTNLTKQVEEKMYAAFAIGARSESRTLPLKRPADAEGSESRQPRTNPPATSPASNPPETITDTPMTDANPPANPSPNPPNQTQSSAPLLRAFALVDEVTLGSPGEVDGLRLGDQLLRFGGVNAESVNALQGVAAALQGGVGQPIAVEVLRRGEKVALAVTPRGWSGRGLLGCHIRPL